MNGGATQSAHVSVHGQLDLPEEMNFYFPLAITTRTGFTMKLLLGQTGTGANGWLAVADYMAATSSYVAGCINLAVGQPVMGCAMLVAFGTILNLLIGRNPWYVTAIGTQEWPAVVVPGVDKKSARGVMCTGASSPGKKQAAFFFYDPATKPEDDADYTFKLKLFDEVPLSNQARSG